MVNVMGEINVFQEGSLLKLLLVFVGLAEDGLPRLDVDGDISHKPNWEVGTHCRISTSITCTSWTRSVLSSFYKIWIGESCARGS